VGGSPIFPPIGRGEGVGNILPDCFSLFSFEVFPFVENPQEEDPCQFGDVLEGTCAVGAAQDVANGPYGVSEGLRGTVRSILRTIALNRLRSFNIALKTNLHVNLTCDHEYPQL
jgi:hypothetical protein